MDMTQTPDLYRCLTSASWRRLLAMMARAGLPCSTRWAKAKLVQTLHHYLLQPQTLSTIIPQLSPTVHRALQVVGQADGALPAAAFFRMFGEPRPYRPWRADKAESPPWQTPASPTEQLWYLGLLYLDPPRPTPGTLQRAVLPAELLPILKSLLAVDQPAGSPRLLTRPGVPPDLVWHLGLWLATVAGEPPTLIRGGWLPPTALAKLARRMGLDQAADFQQTRSERQTPYLAFLHYLAQAVALVNEQAGLTLTPLGWQWLAEPSAMRWQQLWQAWLATPAALAQPFYFAWARLTPPAKQLILAQVRQLPVDRFVALEQFVVQVQLHDVYQQIGEPGAGERGGEGETRGQGDKETGAQETEEDGELAVTSPVTAFCCEPLFWFGLLDIATREVGRWGFDVSSAKRDAGERLIRLTPRGAWLLGLADWGAPPFADVAPCTVAIDEADLLLVPPTVLPFHLARLAAFCTWAPPTNAVQAQRLHLAPERVGQAVADGVTPAQIIQSVYAALGQPPSRRLQQRLRTWAKAGEAVRIQPMLVLETAHATLLGQLRSRKLVRRQMAHVLSPTRVAIHPAGLAALQQTLRTLGLYTRIPASFAKAPTHDGPEAVGAPEADRARAAVDAGLLWLLVQVYQGLGVHADLPVLLPMPLVETLYAQLTGAQQAAAESAAQQVLAQVAAGMQGYLRLPAWRMVTQGGHVLPLIEKALTEHRDLQITYWGAGEAEKTVRRVTPYWLETHQTVRYLVAYCHLREAERVFRLDRIEACAVVTEDAGDNKTGATAP